VTPLVQCQLVLVTVSNSTAFALKRFLPCVAHYVFTELRAGDESLLTVVAFKSSVVQVTLSMIHHVEFLN
jgi:hypothetical protein